MAARFSYNTYGPGRTRPLSTGEAHWRGLGIKMGMKMRKPASDPLHKLSVRERYSMGSRYGQGKEAKAAFLTPV